MVDEDYNRFSSFNIYCQIHCLMSVRKFSLILENKM